MNPQGERLTNPGTSVREGAGVPGAVREPRRIQLRRTKGWRKPAGAVVVSRPSKWGNPISIGDVINGKFVDRKGAVEAYRMHLWTFHGEKLRESLDKELRGKDLACWCKPGEPCHADVLLEVANR